MKRAKEMWLLCRKYTAAQALEWGLITRVSDGNGSAIEVEVWEIPSAELGSFLTGIPAPLGLGKVELCDGRWETGFICDVFGLEGARDITSFGGWTRWIASTASAAANATSRAVAQ